MPTKQLLLKYRYSSNIKAPIPVGIVPVREFSSRVNKVNDFNEMREFGIVPIR